MKSDENPINRDGFLIEEVSPLNVKVSPLNEDVSPLNEKVSPLIEEVSPIIEEIPRKNFKPEIEEEQGVD